MEFVDEGQVINDYGATVPDEYGGLHGDELMHLVALFTDHLAEHEAALRARLPFPDRLRVARAERTLRDVDAATAEIRRRLATERPDLRVYMIGNTVRDGQFVTGVGVDLAHGDDVVRDIEALAAPYPVSVLRMGQPRSLSG